jgi:hypothetical protein
MSHAHDFTVSAVQRASRPPPPAPIETRREHEHHEQLSRQAQLTLLAPVPACDLVRVHRTAVSYGANDTHSSRETEMQASPTELLCLALPRLPDLAISTLVVQSLGGRARALRMDDVAQMRSQTAGTLRLCQRALEVDGRNVGYRLEEWRTTSLETTSAVLRVAHQAARRGEACSTPVGELREAARTISRALAACESDRMAVPGHLSDALGRLLLLFMLASDLRAHHR